MFFFFLLVLHISGYIEFTKFYLDMAQCVVKPADLLLFATKFSLHTIFVIIKIMLPPKTDISHKHLCC